jgi:hypothetical protein
MEIRSGKHSLDISGTPAELRAIADQIAAMSAGELSFAATPVPDPRPYARSLAELTVRVTDGPVRVSIDGETVLATGSAPMLGGFTSFLRFHPDARPGTHSHHEWFDGNQYIRSDSIPLVVRIAQAE